MECGLYSVTCCDLVCAVFVALSKCDSNITDYH